MTRIGETGMGFKVCVLSSIECRRRWDNASADRDRSALWPGYRRFVSDWLHGLSSFVMGAEVEGSRVLAGRAKFTGSSIYPKLWHYGYLFTSLEYRRTGVARLILAAGLNEIRRRGGVSCVCYIDGENIASRQLNESAGFQSLPLIRVRLRARKTNDASVAGELKRQDADNLLAIPRGAKLLAKLTSPSTQAIVMEEFLSSRSIWLSNRRIVELFEMSVGGRVVGFANWRDGNANVILDPEEVVRQGPVLIQGVVAMLSKSKNISQVCLFCPLSCKGIFLKMPEYLAVDSVYSCDVL